MVTETGLLLAVFLMAGPVDTTGEEKGGAATADARQAGDKSPQRRASEPSLAVSPARPDPVDSRQAGDKADDRQGAEGGLATPLEPATTTEAEGKGGRAIRTE